MATKTIKFLISGTEERASMVTTLAVNGYKVWVEKISPVTFEADYYVCVEVESVGG